MLQEINLPEIKIASKEKNKATFIVEPLYPGYGMTIGNALRRVLLSSLEGAAPVSIRIKGVSHEFSTIPNVKENVVEILLNVKQLRLKLHSNESKIITIDVKGEKEVKASDIKAPSEVEIINPNLHIATLDNNKAELSMEIEVDKGRGYETIDKREGVKAKIGTIALDSVYSPVKKVRYDVSTARLGKVINMDKLTIDIETDGTIGSDEAIKQASFILIDHFNILSAQKSIKSEKKEEKKVQPKKEVDSVEIEELDLPARAMNAFLANNIKTVGDALKIGVENLSKLKGLGKKAVEELNKKLKDLDTELK